MCVCVCNGGRGVGVVLQWAEVKDQVHSPSYYWNCNSMITLDHMRAINQIGLTEDEKLY